MSYFAIIEWDDETKTKGVVSNYIKAGQDFIDSGHAGCKSCIVEDESRGASVGGLYDNSLGFYDARPYPSWTLNTETLLWEPPIEMPPDGRVGWGYYQWNEEQQRWDQVDDEE